MAEGFIKVHRQLLDHQLWLSESFSKGQAWVDIMLRVNHTEGQWFDGASYCTIERGAMVTSEKKLASRWGWSRSKVRNFLKMLEKASMIDQKKDSKKTYLKVLQYSVWQDVRTSKRHKKNIERTSREHQRDTNKNVKNNKEEGALLEKRIKVFEDEVKAFAVKYGDEMINNFLSYWTEPNKSRTKFKKEMERTWDTKRRLATWASRDIKFNTKQSGRVVTTPTKNL